MEIIGLSDRDKTLLTKIFDTVSYTVFALYLFYDLFRLSMVEDYLGNYIPVYLILYFVIVSVPVLAVISLLTKFKNKKELIIYALLLLFFYIANRLEEQGILSTDIYYTSYHFMCFIIIAKNLDFRKIAKIYLAITSLVVVLTISCSLAGKIPDLIYEETGRSSRHSLGFEYPLVLPSYLLMLSIVYCYLKNGLLRIWEYILLIGMWSVSMFICKALTTSLLFGLLIAGTMLRQILVRKDINKSNLYGKVRNTITYVFKNSYLLMLLIMLLGAVLYVPPITGFLAKIPMIDTFTSRFAFGREGLLNYFPTVLGRSFPYQGHINTVKPEDFFVIDSSYYLLIIYFGVIGAPIVLYGLQRSLKMLYSQRKAYALCLVFVFSVLCSMESRMFSISYNLFLLLLLARPDTVFLPQRNMV